LQNHSKIPIYVSFIATDKKGKEKLAQNKLIISLVKVKLIGELHLKESSLSHPQWKWSSRGVQKFKQLNQSIFTHI